MVSKSVWNLPGGPWERLFAGVWNQFNVAVYENEDKILLTTIFPKSGEVNWIMVRIDKMLLIPKGIESLEGKLDSSAHILKQKLPGKEMTYLILLSPPTSVEFGSKEIGSKVFQKVLKIEEEAEKVKNLAKKEGVEVIDLKEAPYKESASILGNPTILLSLLSIAPEGEEPKKEKLKELIIGEEKDELFSISAEIFDTYSSVKKGSEEERNYLAQALLEEAIIDASPMPMVFDFCKYGLKLQQGNPYPYDYEKYGFKTHNVGFELDYYDLASAENDVTIDLNKVTPQFVWKVFGLGAEEVSTLILETVARLQQTKSLDSIDRLEEEIKKLSATKGTNNAIASRALRIVRVVKKTYEGIFAKSGDMSDRISDMVKNNKTMYFRLYELDKRKRLAYLLYILDSIDYLKESKELSDIERKRLEYIYPCLLSMDWFGEGVVESEIVERIINNHRGGLFVGESDMPIKLESRVKYRFQVVAPKRAKVFDGGRGREFGVRPLLSCPP
jgi:hypothetical protein